MESEEMININVIIADRPYRLKVKPSEEEHVRRAAKMINQKVKEFQNTYEAKDKQDYLAMGALLFAVDTLNLKNKTSERSDQLDQQLKEMDELVDKFLAG